MSKKQLIQSAKLLPTSRHQDVFFYLSDKNYNSISVLIQLICLHW